MSLLKAAVASMIPGGQLLSMALSSAGATDTESSAVHGLYNHIRQTAIGSVLPADIGVLVKMVVGGSKVSSSVFPAVASAVANPAIGPIVAAQIDSIMASYPGSNDVLAVVEKLSASGAIPGSTADETFGSYIVSRLKELSPPVAQEEQPLIIPHTCPNCRFVHIVRAGA